MSILPLDVAQRNVRKTDYAISTMGLPFGFTVGVMQHVFFSALDFFFFRINVKKDDQHIYMFAMRNHKVQG